VEDENHLESILNKVALLSILLLFSMALSMLVIGGYGLYQDMTLRENRPIAIETQIRMISTNVTVTVTNSTKYIYPNGTVIVCGDNGCKDVVEMTMK
jgi:hypothetical protein